MNITKGKIAMVLIAAVLLMLFAAYSSFDHILIYLISRTYNARISYSNFKMASPKEFTFDNLTVLNKKMGLGLFSRSADAKLLWHHPPSNNLVIDFMLRDVNFLRDEPAQEMIDYDSLYKIVSIPFDSNWTYKTISGKIGPSKDYVNITDFMATSDDIKISFNGTLFYNQTLDMDTVIYFSDKAIKIIPKELSTVVLQNERDGWKSLSVKLEGDYKHPAIQLSSKLFRLNIKTVYEPEKPAQD